MFNSTCSPDDIRKNVSWPQGPPSRLIKEEGGDPGNPRPPTGAQLIKLLKGCELV